MSKGKAARDTKESRLHARLSFEREGSSAPGASGRCYPRCNALTPQEAGRRRRRTRPRYGHPRDLRGFRGPSAAVEEQRPDHLEASGLCRLNLLIRILHRLLVRSRRTRTAAGNALRDRPPAVIVIVELDEDSAGAMLTTSHVMSFRLPLNEYRVPPASEGADESSSCV